MSPKHWQPESGAVLWNPLPGPEEGVEVWTPHDPTIHVVNTSKA